MADDKKKEQEEQPVDPAMEAMEAVALAVGEDPTARVYLQRQDPETKDWRHLRRYAPSDFDVEDVREQYQGGDYRIRIKNQKGQFVGSVLRFSIEGEPYTPTRDELAPAGGEPGAPSKDDRTFELLLAMITAQANSKGPDPTAMATAIAEAQARGMGQLAEIVGMRNEMARNQPDPGAAAERIMDAFMRGMEMGREAREDGASTGSVVREMMPILDRLTGGEGGGMQATTENSGAGTAASYPPPPKQRAPAAHPLQLALEMLMPAAESGSQLADAYAAIVMEQVPGLEGAVREAVAEAGGVDAFMTHIRRLDQRVELHHIFFESAIEYVLMDDEEDTDDERTDTTPPSPERPEGSAS